MTRTSLVAVCSPPLLLLGSSILNPHSHQGIFRFIFRPTSGFPERASQLATNDGYRYVVFYCMFLLFLPFHFETSLFTLYATVHMFAVSSFVRRARASPLNLEIPCARYANARWNFAKCFLFVVLYSLIFHYVSPVISTTTNSLLLYTIVLNKYSFTNQIWY